MTGPLPEDGRKKWRLRVEMQRYPWMLKCCGHNQDQKDTTALEAYNDVLAHSFLPSS